MAQGAALTFCLTNGGGYGQGENTGPWDLSFVSLLAQEPGFYGSEAIVWLVQGIRTSFWNASLVGQD